MSNNGIQKWIYCKSACKCFFKTTQNDNNIEIFNDHNRDKISKQDINR